MPNVKKTAFDEVAAFHKSEIDALNATISNCDNKADSLKADLGNARARLKRARKEKRDISAIAIEIEAILQEQRDNRGEKKDAEKAIKDLQKQMEEEVKPILKKKIDYDIPVAKVDDAGITTTGAASEGNQLPELVEEYREYSTKNRLWNPIAAEFSYKVDSQDIYYSYVNGKEKRKL